jgi:drug/metabolite transporter (DMT)-like permease
VLSACSGVLLTATIALMKLTVSLGPAAPGMAIANANAIGVLALNTIFFRPPVRTQQIVGLLLSIAGVAVLSVAGVAPKKATTSDAEPMMPASPMIG